MLSAKDLIRQLVEYRKFKEMARSLRQREENQAQIFYRHNIEPILPEPEREEPLREDLGSRVTRGYVIHPGDVELPLGPGATALPFGRLW